MAKPKLTYFDAPVSRGEECRLALHCAGVDFEDVRIAGPDWATLKPSTPFGSMPIFELPDRPLLAQSNAILVYIGREYDLHPSDNFEAARHEAIMHHVEDLRAAVAPTLRMRDAEKRSAREALVATYLPTWAANAEKHILGPGPFFAGSKLHVVDLKLHVAVRWLAAGTLDHVPATIFVPYPKLNRIHDAVNDHPRIKAWYARG
jgi:glutathione S-transferase